MGYPHTVSQVLGIVQQTVDLKGITHVWWHRFCQRHSGISLGTAVPISMARVMATDAECIEKYFDLLEVTLKLTIPLGFITLMKQGAP